jgi:O-antigen ligase
LAVNQEWRERIAFAPLFICALILGGGGWHNSSFVAVIQSLAIPPLVLSVGWRRKSAAFSALPPVLIILAILTLGIAQLVPLPPKLWSALPGRALLTQAVILTLGQLDWRAFSLAPELTAQTLLALLPSVAAFCYLITMPRTRQPDVLFIIYAMALVSVVIGLLQVLSPIEAPFYLYRLPPYQLPVGFFANRNHQADFLLWCMTAAVPLVIRVRATSVRVGLVLMILLTAVCVIATGSRTGLLLILPMLTFAALAEPTFRRMIRTVSGRQVAIAVAGLALLALGLHNYLLPRTLERFDSIQDQRLQFWPDVVYLYHLYAPAGAGGGTFDLVFRSVERLDFLNPAYVNHAHNDYIEIAVEYGFAGIAMVVAFLGWFVWRAAIVWRARADNVQVVMQRVATIQICGLLLHSLVDYPLRTQTIALLFAFSCATLVECRWWSGTGDDSFPRRGGKEGRPVRLASGLGTLR